MGSFEEAASLRSLMQRILRAGSGVGIGRGFPALSLRIECTVEKRTRTEREPRFVLVETSVMTKALKVEGREATR